MKNNEMPTVYLHIGMPKTGTTAERMRNRKMKKLYEKMPQWVRGRIAGVIEG